MLDGMVVGGVGLGGAAAMGITPLFIDPAKPADIPLAPLDAAIDICESAVVVVA
jgi:hypothetical protein